MKEPSLWRIRHETQHVAAYTRFCQRYNPKRHVFEYKSEEVIFYKCDRTASLERAGNRQITEATPQRRFVDHQTLSCHHKSTIDRQILRQFGDSIFRRRRSETCQKKYRSSCLKPKDEQTEVYTLEEVAHRLREIPISWYLPRCKRNPVRGSRTEIGVRG